jgi:ATP-dependent 26S proteasome regulatory subunit
LATISEGLSGGDVLNCVLLAASTAVERGAARVTLADFEAAIDQVRRAKEEVGIGPTAPRLMLVDEQDAED